MRRKEQAKQRCTDGRHRMIPKDTTPSALDALRALTQR
jgi:hypothetical protein